MKKICICVVGYNDPKIFGINQALKGLESQWPKDKYKYTLESLSVSYIDGGIHTYTSDFPDVFNLIYDDLQSLVQDERFNEYIVKIFDE